MAESKSPIICVTCHRTFPDDLNQDDAPRYFAQLPLLPRTDDAYDFGWEVNQMLGYIKAVATVLRYGENKNVEPETYDALFGLVGELGEEAMRRLRLSTDGAREIENREEEAKKAPHARKEGV